MFPIYMYVDKYKGLKEFEITFDNNYEIKYNREEDMLSINKKCESENQNIKNFYSIDKTIGNIDSVNLLIGKNGSGKTNVLEMLNLSKERQEIDYIIIYKSVENNEDFIIEKNGLSKFIKIKEFKEIKLENEFYKYHDDKNYIKNTGVIKFLFKEKVISAAIREEKFEKENRGESKTNLYKLNIGLRNGSKEKIYHYLINMNQKENNDNFENAYLTLIIPDLYEMLKKSQDKEIEKIKVEYDLHSDEINNIFKLYDKNQNNLKYVVLNSYYNYLYLKIILEILNNDDEKTFSKKKLRELKKEFLKLLKNKSANEKFKILFLLKLPKNDSFNLEFRYILRKYEKLSDNQTNKQYKFNKKSYTIVKDIDTLINSILISRDKMNIKNDESTKKIIINSKDEEKEEDIIKLLKKYDFFHNPNSEIIGELLFKEVEFIKIEEEGLSDGEKVKLGYFSTLYSILNGEFKNKKYVTLLFDEVETYLHPEWSRRFLYELIEELGRYEEKKFKLIFATHSPFLIADVLAKDCIYLSKNKKGKIQAEIKEDVKTFGANIIDLFKNTMFLESTFGKFATEKIKGIVDKIEKAEKYSDIKSEANFIINEIGEKLISNKLKSMIESKFENKDEEKDEEYYRKKIEEYQAKLGELEKKENNRNSKK